MFADIYCTWHSQYGYLQKGTAGGVRFLLGSHPRQLVNGLLCRNTQHQMAQRGQMSSSLTLPTLIKKKIKCSSYIGQSEAVAKSYMRKGFLIYEEMRKYFPIYEEAVSHIWLCNCFTLNFLIYEENLIFFCTSVLQENPLLYRRQSSRRSLVDIICLCVSA